MTLHSINNVIASAPRQSTSRHSTYYSGTPTSHSPRGLCDARFAACNQSLRPRTDNTSTSFYVADPRRSVWRSVESDTCGHLRYTTTATLPSTPPDPTLAEPPSQVNTTPTPDPAPPRAPRTPHLTNPERVGEAGVLPTLVLDLDETLVHSSFDPSPADFIIPIVVEGESHTVYVRKRPHLEYFLRKCTEMFEVVIWTASLSVYAEPLIDQLLLASGTGMAVQRLFRNHCTEVSGGYVKDLSQLGRNLDRVVIIDNTPAAALFHPRNLISITSWYDDVTDSALLKLLPTLERVTRTQRVYDVLMNTPEVQMGQTA